jgi:hypothetical protein
MPPLQFSLPCRGLSGIIEHSLQGCVFPSTNVQKPLCPFLQML